MSHPGSKAKLTVNGHLWPASPNLVEKEGPSGQSSQTDSSPTLQNRLSLLPAGGNENQSGPLQYCIPNPPPHPPWLASFLNNWGGGSAVIPLCVCVGLQWKTGFSVWLWKSVSRPSSWHLLFRKASDPLSIYAVSERLENPDLFALRMTISSLKK